MQGYFKDENLGCILPNKCQYKRNTGSEHQINFLIGQGESESQTEPDYEADYDYTPELGTDNKTTNGPNIKCKLNEHFSECGSVCRQSCDREESCTLDCKPGCFCDQGLLRNNDEVCVPEELVILNFLLKTILLKYYFSVRLQICSKSMPKPERRIFLVF